MSGQQTKYKVSMSLLKVQNLDDVHNLAKEISNFLPNFAISNITVNTTELSFDLSPKDKNTVSAEDAGLEIKKIIDKNSPPFEIVGGKVVDKVVNNVDDKIDDSYALMFSWS